jgi:hypothetical protein
MPLFLPVVSHVLRRLCRCPLQVVRGAGCGCAHLLIFAEACGKVVMGLLRAPNINHSRLEERVKDIRRGRGN